MKQVPVIVLGVGGVGRALLEQIITSREPVAARQGARFKVVAVADSRSWRWEPAGLDDDALRELVAAKKKRQPLGEEAPSATDIVEIAISAGLQQAILVDVTAEDGLEPALDRALEAGYGVVLANKKALAGPWETAQNYFNQPRLRYQSTAGGGQPVVSTLRYLLDTGDPIRRIEGQLSSTLNYICQRLDDGTRFSVALAAAKALGFTEPDPREDLGGRDVMRKLLILGRTAGWPLEEQDIEVEALYSPALAHLDAMEFMVASMSMDPSLGDRVNAAGAAGEVLRYVAELEEGQGRVGLKAVPVESPLANLKYVGMYSGRYASEPLMVGSNVGGVQTTAAGVLGDMIDLVRCSFGG